MKFENVKNVERLFQIIRDECSGTVELVSSEGDRINLKSRLSPVYFQWYGFWIRNL